MDLAKRDCGQIGVTRRASILGFITGPPAESEYADEEGHVIYYSQGGNVAATGLKMDIEADYGEIEVNGYKGYFYKKAGCNSLLWSDGVSLFQIIGNCDMETLKKMVV